VPGLIYLVRVYAIATLRGPAAAPEGLRQRGEVTVGLPWA